MFWRVHSKGDEVIRMTTKQGLFEGAPHKWSKDRKIGDQNLNLKKKRLKTRDIRLRTKM